MSRIIVNEYPHKSYECPMSRYIATSNFDGHYACNCSQSLCVIDDEYLENHVGLVEYRFDKQAYCKEHCHYLRDFDSLFEDRMSEYNCQKFKDTKSYW